MKELSKETIEKISQVKLEASRKDILANIVKNNLPEQINNNLAVPSHRTRKQISFDEFKTLMQEGKTFKELCQAYSKHLMAFYNYLSRGQVSITKEQFEEQYNQGIPLDEIAKTSDTPRAHITYLREYYGIKRKGATYQRRLKIEEIMTPLTKEAEDILIGSMLGDGHIGRSGDYREKHSEKQIAYLEWKASLFKDIIKDTSFYGETSIDKRSGNKIYTFGFRTCVHSKILELRDVFYKEVNGDRKKILPDNIESMINERVLAVWFMDDGHTDWNRRTKMKHPHWDVKHQCKISSESFTLEENQLLQKILKEKFGLIANICFREKGNIRPYLRFTTDSSQRFIDIIRPFVLTNDMKYKIDLNSFLIKEKNLSNIDKDILLKDFLKSHNM